MKRLVSVSLALFCCIALLVATERRAWGYVDPGSGLLAIQSIGSVMVAAGYFLRRRILSLFTKPKQEKTPIVLPVAAAKNNSRNAA